MKANIPLVVRQLVAEYRRFLSTSYRFLDPRLREQFEAHLAAADVIVRGPYVTLARDFIRGETLAALIAAGRAHEGLASLKWAFGSDPLFLHQQRALEIGRAGRSVVVTTGTGSGKTEAFLLPVLDGILRRKAQGATGVQAVLLYPMNALANDQLERLRRLLRGTGSPLSFALYTGDSEETSKSLKEDPAETERTTRRAIQTEPPDLLLTNYKQLEFLLVRKNDRALFGPNLKYLVLDEVHSYRGALATEIACLVRRLKAHAGLGVGGLQGLATSATVAGEGGAKEIASFASVLLGEDVREEDVLGESLRPFPATPLSAAPLPPAIAEADIAGFNPTSDAAVVALTERLTGRRCATDGAIADRVAHALVGNPIVRALEETFSKPESTANAARILQERFSSRSSEPSDAVLREVEAYLLVGSVGDEDHPPRLRPKLHTFFHGVYDVALCIKCRTLVPQGGERCPQCASIARPAALCRTCGQDFIKMRYGGGEEDRPTGTADFFSDDNTAFLTHEIHELEDRDEPEDDDLPSEPARGGRSKVDAEGPPKFDSVMVCASCGRVSDGGKACPDHPSDGIRMWQRRGGLSSCPACGDTFTRGDIVTPLRTGTASTVSVIATHHLDHLEGDDRRLLVFSDNRQDAAHQAGYTGDKHRTLALRHAMAKVVRDAGAAGLALVEMPQRLFDVYRELGIVPRKTARHERDRWIEALEYLCVNEVTRYTRQRASLENLGLIGVEYEFLDDLVGNADFRSLCRSVGLDAARGGTMVRAVLDAMRKARAVAYSFFQEWLDPEKRTYRELEAEPYCVRFPDRDRKPVAYGVDRDASVRQAQRLLGFFQENRKAGGLAATQKVVARVLGDGRRADSEEFLRRLVPLLGPGEAEILSKVPMFPCPAKDRPLKWEPWQLAPRGIRLVARESGWRCSACRTWRPYDFPGCPTPKCSKGRLLPVEVDRENYYVGLYTERPPQRLKVLEHSAQVGGKERAERETAFKEGKLDVLVCTPTLELGVDIGPLLTVVLRTAPPTPANYAQRVGRAGRRLRIGFASTFCTSGSHDRHAFENPGWLVAGRFDPPRLRLDNPKVVDRHLRSHLLECLSAQLPTRMGDLLDDMRAPTTWVRSAIDGLLTEVRSRRDELVGRLDALLTRDRAAGRLPGYGHDRSEALVDGFERELVAVLEAWWQRVRQLDKEFRDHSTIGSPRQDEKKAAARKRAYWEITQDPERAYALNYLSTQGLLPAYQFPLDTFRLDPGVSDTPTLYRSAALAIEEFAPGNYVYANGHKLKSLRVLYPGGPGAGPGRVGKTDAEASGRLESFHFCPVCGEATRAPQNECARCGTALSDAVNAVFVQAFEAEESLRIGSDEETRQRERYDKRESLIVPPGTATRLYPYTFSPAEHLRLAELLVTNWGRTRSKTSDGPKFLLCPDCGRHLPHDEHANEAAAKRWRENHQKFCTGEPTPLVLAYRHHADALVLHVPALDVEETGAVAPRSRTVVTLAEALLIGASTLLELESGEVAAFLPRPLAKDAGHRIVFYETTPGGAGYLEEMVERLPAVANAALERLMGHRCSGSCYLCLKRYGNQHWHERFDKGLVYDHLFTLAHETRPAAVDAVVGEGADRLRSMLEERRKEADAAAVKDPRTGRYRRGPIEEPLAAALAQVEGLPVPNREREFFDGPRLVTVPDFTWDDAKLAVYCDGFAVHGNVDALLLDAQKRNWLQGQGWCVLTYWGRQILRDPPACARQIGEVHRQRRPKSEQDG